MIPMCLTVLLLPFDKDSDEEESASSCNPESDSGENEDDALRRKCQSLAERYGLTNRETEITEYLMQGRSQPYIKDVLHISLSTVGPHARSIYRKLGAHTKQELIDLLSGE